MAVVRAFVRERFGQAHIEGYTGLIRFCEEASVRADRPARFSGTLDTTPSSTRSGTHFCR
eukprot:7294758-Lingulodinium_polyedra.AAC.1